MWFGASIIKSVLIDGEERADSTWEHSIVLVAADSESAAIESARRIAKAREVTYLNEQNQRVSWRLVEVSKVFEICDEKLGEGSEVYSELLDRKEALCLLERNKR